MITRRIRGVLCWLIIGCAAVLVFALSVPAPSFKRSLTLTNHLGSTVAVSLRIGQAPPKRRFNLEPGQTLGVKYFSGDSTERPSVRVVLEVEELATQRKAQRLLALPINTPPPPIYIENNWFVQTEHGDH